ncbi:MAG: HlyD family efflux transporter periplasmic adaptor subunit [Dehalococcoidia bacterium]|nr:HlyD family efflux transporter periplasmic adaptor subunit [Dehalococcoidia bacterium]
MAASRSEVSRSDVSVLIARRPLWRRGRVVASVVLIGFLAGLGYYGFLRSRPAAPISTTQEVKVTLGSLSTTLSASGTAAAEQSTPLTFSTGGVVTQVLVRLGDEVKSGQALVRLDPRDPARSVETARSSLDLARLRLKQLLEPNAIERTAMQQTLVGARTQLESAEAAYASLGKPTASELIAAQNAVASAQASVRSAQNSVDSSRSSLSLAQTGYCSLWLEATIGVCTPDRLPISAEFVAMLQTSIERGTTVPTTSLTSAVISLISANALYTNALANKGTAANALVAAEVKLRELTAPTAEAIRSAQAAIQNARAAYDSALAKADALGKPTDVDLGLQQQAVRTAEIALQQAQDALNDTTLAAPFGGKVGSVTAIVGQRIGSGAAAVVLSNPDAIRLDLTISETDLVNVKAGMIGVARFDSLPRSAYVVRVVGVSAVPVVTQGVVTYPVQAAILRGSALNDIREQLPALTRALTSGAAGAQFGALLGTGGAGGGPQAQQGQRGPGAGPGAGAPGTRGPGGGAASTTTGIPTGSGTPTSTGTPGAGGAGGAGGLGGGTGGGAGIQALLNPPLPTAGMNASVTLLVSSLENQLLVPTGAVRRQGNQSFVYLPGTAGGPPVQKQVVAAGTDGTNTAIASGLAEGDVVLLGAIGTATPAASRTNAPGGIGGGPGGGPGGGGGIR